MPRRRIVAKREINPDPKFNSVLVSRFINVVMQDGKKSLAERLVYRAFDIIAKKTTNDPLEIFQQAMDNVKPSLEVKSRRVGGSTYQIPIDVKPARKVALAIRWIILNSRKRGERGFHNRLAAELMDAANRTGAAVKKKEDTHKMAEANKAFSHYKW